MTSLEIKRLDSLPPNGNLAASPSKSINSYHSRKSNLPNMEYMEKSAGKNGNAGHEIQINIIKSPSYSLNMLQSNNNQSPSSSTTSNNTKQQNNSSNTNKLETSMNSAMLNESDLAANNYNTDSLKFNKYGFAQPNEITNLIESENLQASENAQIKSASTLSPKDEMGSKRSSNGFVAVTNLKDYLQNADVEQFSENLPIKVIQSRELKWVDMLNNFDEWMSKKYLKIRSRCRKGIPQSMRSKAWMHLTGAFLLKKEKPNYYTECLLNPNKVDIAKYIEDIKKDLHRQFPSHEMFMKKEGRQMLFNVLKAYAVHNREVGYCQAQGPIAALLLMHMPEEDAFWMLVRISDTYLKEYFKPGLEKVQIDGHALFYLFKKENPPAHKLMKQQGIDPILYMTEWFMCVFARTLPWCTVLRVWDMFFCEGIKVLYRVGLYLMLNAFGDKQKFVKCQQQGMYETLNLLKNLPLECLTEINLIRRSCLIKISEKELAKAFEKSKIEFIKQTNEANANRKSAPSYLNPNKSNSSKNKSKK